MKLVRPTYLLVENLGEGLSPRKLVIEAVHKHNVLLADSTEEAEAVLNRFPNIDALIIHSEVKDWRKCVNDARQRHPQLTIIVLGQETLSHGAENAIISGYEPIELVGTLATFYKGKDQVTRRKKM